MAAGVASAQSPLQGIHGTSLFTKPDATFIAAAQFYDFAPSPCSCYACCFPNAAKKRLFMRAYDNRLEMNEPIAPCCCLCDDELYMTDSTSISFYDKPPFRTGLCCFMPCTCCGPPVIFAYNPKCFCIDMAPCCGSSIQAAPFSCFGLKQGICCCNPCYTQCSRPIMGGLKDPETFLSQLKAATTSYHNQMGIVESERVIYASVSDNVGDFGGSKAIAGADMQIMGR